MFVSLAGFLTLACGTGGSPNGQTGGSGGQGGAGGGSEGDGPPGGDSAPADTTGAEPPRPDGPKEPGPETAAERLLWKWNAAGGDPFSGGANVYTVSAGAGLVYVGLTNGKLVALDAATGKEKWTYSSGTSSFPGIQGQVATADRLFVSAPGTLARVAPDSGTEIWKLGRSSLGGDPGALTLVDGRLYFRATATGGKIHCVDADGGKIVWSSEELGGSHLPDRMVVRKGRVFGQNYDGLVASVDAATGMTLWKKKYEGTFVSPDADPEGTRLFLRTSRGGVVRALDTADGSVVWENKDSAAGGSQEGSGVIWDAGRIFFSDGSALRAVSGSDGKTTWRKSHGGFNTGAEPAVGDGLVFMTIGSASTGPTRIQAVAFDPATGTESWRIMIPDGPSSANVPNTPQHLDGRLYVGGGAIVAAVRTD